MKQTSRKTCRREVPELRPALREVRIGNVEIEVRSRLREVLLQGGMAVAMAMLEEEVERLCGQGTHAERGLPAGGVSVPARP